MGSGKRPVSNLQFYERERVEADGRSREPAATHSQTECGRLEKSRHGIARSGKPGTYRGAPTSLSRRNHRSRQTRAQQVRGKAPTGRQHTLRILQAPIRACVAAIAKPQGPGPVFFAPCENSSLRALPVHPLQNECGLTNRVLNCCNLRRARACPSPLQRQVRENSTAGLDFLGMPSPGRCLCHADSPYEIGSRNQ